MGVVSKTPAKSGLCLPGERGVPASTGRILPSGPVAREIPDAMNIASESPGQ